MTCCSCVATLYHVISFVVMYQITSYFWQILRQGIVGVSNRRLYKMILVLKHLNTFGVPILMDGLIVSVSVDLFIYTHSYKTKSQLTWTVSTTSYLKPMLLSFATFRYFWSEVKRNIQKSLYAFLLDQTVHNNCKIAVYVNFRPE